MLNSLTRIALILFKPHNNPLELEIFIPSYRLGNWDLDWTVCPRSCLGSESWLCRDGGRMQTWAVLSHVPVTNWPRNSSPASWDNSLSWLFLLLSTLFPLLIRPRMPVPLDPLLIFLYNFLANNLWLQTPQYCLPISSSNSVKPCPVRLPVFFFTSPHLGEWHHCPPAAHVSIFS